MDAIPYSNKKRSFSSQIHPQQERFSKHVLSVSLASGRRRIAVRLLVVQLLPFSADGLGGVASQGRLGERVALIETRHMNEYITRKLTMSV